MTNNLQLLREKSPLVHCITNYVAMNIAANTLLASGASPAMIHTPEETADFVKVCGALTVNIGTISPSWFDGMRNAVLSAKESEIPWVFDPVAHFATPYRSQSAQTLLTMNPSILRGNASEILGLGGELSGARGVDSADPVEAAMKVAKLLANKYKSVVIVTGECDFITDGSKEARVRGGSKLMAQVTAIGCSLTCLIGAFAAVTNPFDAGISALTLFAEAGNRAEKLADGPGSFSVHFLDELSKITQNDFDKCEWVDKN
ncbi:MAG: hydroxyethylthiazole kinase [bacterium TMED80]|jgi:hydroxyethylthiazole kinase|nr:hydroxyethylthiazole kinase [Rhodobiaceae bacterium]OUV06139.1 MAG: hydroxyethylthiazole kinase [bacterium TMED80]RZO33835.1 MAG: hydroxyethylthiazole kinase [Hyphomicrobiales bacterium]|tara:strand:+ start:529 stop:1308 length:780 start_codon:yes stop_codon:yes gene_type:complete